MEGGDTMKRLVIAFLLGVILVVVALTAYGADVKCTCGCTIVDCTCQLKPT